MAFGLYLDSASDDERKSMKEELDQMLNVGPHPNIIGLYGSVFYDGRLLAFAVVLYS